MILARYPSIMQLRSHGTKLMLLVLAAFNALLFYSIVQRSHFKNRQEFKRISRNFTRNKLFPSATVENLMDKISQPRVKLRSAFDIFGLAGEHLMRRVDDKRPLLNFTLLPWKIIPTDVPVEFISKERDTNWSMIVVVKSYWKNWERRKTARNTWASLKNLLGVELRTVFIVGSASQPADELALVKENEEFGDLLQINSPDTYSLVGMKTIAGMQWVVDNFPSHWMYSSSDDDMFPNLIDIYEDIEKMMQEQFEESSKFSSPRSIYSEEIITKLPIHCGFSYRDRPRCLRSTKWAISRKEYSLRIYPAYCHGGWYSMPVSLARGIYETSRHHEFFRLDDIWVTSLLRLTYFHELGVDQYFGVNASDYHIGIRAPPEEMAKHGRALALLRAWDNFKLRLGKMNIAAIEKVQ